MTRRLGALLGAGLVPGVLAVVAVALLWQRAGTRRELTFHPDEPAHFITAAMIHDYIVSAPGSSPMAFAEEYYCRYPKVAFGHWPPAFHIALAGVFLVTGVSVSAAITAVALAAAGIAVVLARRVRPAYGLWSGLLIGVTFLGLTTVRGELPLVMADLPLTLVSLLAVLAFADFVAERRLRDAVCFAGLASLAVLTKGNALALALLPPLAILTTGAYGLLRTPKLWLTAVIVGVVCGPWYYFTLQLATGVGSDDGLSRGYLLRNLQVVPGQLLVLANSTLLVLAAVGGVLCLIRPARTAVEARNSLTLRVVLAWVLAVVMFQLLVPITGEPRYLFPALPGILLLAWYGFESVVRMARIRSVWIGRGIPLFGCGLLLAIDARPLRPLVAGYRAAAERIPVADDGPVVLVASNTLGEGAVIVERRLLDQGRTSYVLRASKALASDSWSGACYHSRFETTDELRRYLMDVPVQYLLVDDFPCPEPVTATHLQLLDRLLRESPDDFPLVGAFPIRGWWRLREGAVRLYENRQALDRAPGTIRVDLHRMLNRHVTH
ncbi:MAG: glycosyltransferase family 39 protein [Gemmataceae bacterium]